MLQPTDSPTKAPPQEEEVKLSTTEEPKMVTEPIIQPAAEPVADPLDVRRNSLSGLAETQPEHHIQFFKTSDLEPLKELDEFLKKEMTKSPFNKYCIDCKKKQTTHCVVVYGIFVCEDCATSHLYDYPNGAMSYCYVKKCSGEFWDDYCLKSVQYGGNQPVFDLMKEYEIQDLELSKRYVQPALIWYRKKHLATMDGFGPEWNLPKPPKNFDERVARTKVQLKTGTVVAGKVLHEVQGKTVRGGVAFAGFVDRGGKKVYDKLKDKPWAQKIGAKFQSITNRTISQNNRSASMDESGPPNFASNSSSEKIEEEKKQEGIIEPNKTPQEAGLMD